MSVELFENERIDDLQFRGLRIIQNINAFCVSMDAVLLADFATARPGDVVVDLGTGTGILPLLISSRVERTRFHAFEILREMAEMAERSVEMNGLEERISIYAQDLVQAPKLLKYGSADLVISNPPYSKQGTSIENPDFNKRTARHEGDRTLNDFVQTAAKLLKTRGRFAVVFPVQRMLELADAMRANKIEPKRLRMVHPKPDRAPNLVLLEGVKLGKPMLHVAPPLIVYDENGNETDELKRIYRREESISEVRS